ncbi:MAG: hypothetical protein AB1705_19755 [Verrucomicrobiota bacterium]
MNLVFNVVAYSLEWVASVTGFSYNEINIIAYYIILPFVYVALIDRGVRRHFFKLVYVATWAGVLCLIKDFAAFSDVLFAVSVDFLQLFSHVGLNYVSASVVICVILPGLVFVALLLFAFPALRQRLFPRNGPQRTPGRRELNRMGAIE